jgi:DNA mismatch repair ATPase MutS
MERFKFRSGSNLAKLISPLQNSERLPTSYLRKALWLSIAASAQKNEVIRLLFNVLFPWDLFFAYRLAIYKESLRERLPIWLGTVNSFEALCSLATFRAINAHVTFPNVIQHDPDDPLRSSFVGKNIGHPLLPVKSRVTNDFTIEGVGEIALVTGSNMSGKSTFLRTVGVNISLAQAGGPVDAESLTLTPSRLFTCINVSDSVNDGISYFYAEVKRLKRLLDQINSDGPPVLFLVDEIFRGTNNRERFTGSRALLLSLAQLSAVGLVSTHDLDLVDLENAEGASIANYHFREHIEGGKMVFDYELRPGPCPTTNALAIMELEGLPITAP